MEVIAVTISSLYIQNRTRRKNVSRIIDKVIIRDYVSNHFQTAVFSLEDMDTQDNIFSKFDIIYGIDHFHFAKNERAKLTTFATSNRICFYTSTPKYYFQIKLHRSTYEAEYEKWKRYIENSKQFQKEFLIIPTYFIQSIVQEDLRRLIEWYLAKDWKVEDIERHLKKNMERFKINERISHIAVAKIKDIIDAIDNGHYTTKEIKDGPSTLVWAMVPWTAVSDLELIK